MVDTYLFPVDEAIGNGKVYLLIQSLFKFRTMAGEDTDHGCKIGEGIWREGQRSSRGRCLHRPLSSPMVDTYVFSVDEAIGNGKDYLLIQSLFKFRTMAGEDTYHGCKIGEGIWREGQRSSRGQCLHPPQSSPVVDTYLFPVDEAIGNGKDHLLIQFKFRTMVGEDTDHGCKIGEGIWREGSSSGRCLHRPQSSPMVYTYLFPVDEAIGNGKDHLLIQLFKFRTTVGEDTDHGCKMVRGTEAMALPDPIPI